MSESDTMFNDPSHDNRTIASTLKMQIWTVQRLRAQLNKLDDPLEVVERMATSFHHAGLIWSGTWYSATLFRSLVGS